MQIKRKNYKHLKSMLLSDGINDPEYVETFKNFWNKFLKQGLSVVAFTENVNGGKPIIAGCNMLGLSFKGEEFDYNAIKVSFIRFLDLRKENKIARNGLTFVFQSENGQKVVKAIVELSKKANVFEKYGVDKYMTAFGLSVNPSYRGAALGGHLLNARYKSSIINMSFYALFDIVFRSKCFHLSSQLE